MILLGMGDGFNFGDDSYRYIITVETIILFLMYTIDIRLPGGLATDHVNAINAHTIHVCRVMPIVMAYTHYSTA